ncbi:hypothetical protein PHYBOEH_004609 [Phytophthora boehmeriae]|uniref:Uncharacterized protein n=1 Tax=Phytophthora boehmeriae TaxID=109152 RepID=A0A8T1WSG9_9STRA|nr:hypothetical protein PHYBOEH_004609 [Phytophthora boehmeriae]
MGCCPSKCFGLKTEKDDAATTSEPVAVVPASNQVQHNAGQEAHEVQIDRSDTSAAKAGREEPVDTAAVSVKLPLDLQEGVTAVQTEAVRAPEETTTVRTTPPRKTSNSADDIPISSTYHRVHSAEVAEQESKRHEELQRQAEQRDREVREYKAAMGL